MGSAALDVRPCSLQSGLWSGANHHASGPGSMKQVPCGWPAYHASVYHASVYHASVYHASVYHASVYHASVYHACAYPVCAYQGVLLEPGKRLASIALPVSAFAQTIQAPRNKVLAVPLLGCSRFPSRMLDRHTTRESSA
jgi:hypothetical protein